MKPGQTRRVSGGREGEEMSYGGTVRDQQARVKRDGKGTKKLTGPMIELLDLLTPIAFQRAFVPFGGAKCALLLSQGFYWQKYIASSNSHKPGWFYKTDADWWTEIGLTPYELRKAREQLRGHGVLECKRFGLPPKLHYRVNVERLLDLIKCSAKNGALERANSTPADGSSNCGQTSQFIVGKLHKPSEITSETTKGLEVSSRASRDRYVSSESVRSTIADSSPSMQEVIEFGETQGADLAFSQYFRSTNAARGWKYKGKRIRNWKGLFVSWLQRGGKPDRPSNIREAKKYGETVCCEAWLDQCVDEWFDSNKANHWITANGQPMCDWRTHLENFIGMWEAKKIGEQ